MPKRSDWGQLVIGQERTRSPKVSPSVGAAGIIGPWRTSGADGLEPVPAPMAPEPGECSP